jgi:hypothetical protein
VEDTASAAGGSTAVSPATDSAVRGDSEVEGFLVGENMGASLIAVSVGVIAAFVIGVFATSMGASSDLDILTITHFIIPTITRTIFTGVILDTKVPSNCSKPHWTLLLVFPEFSLTPPGEARQNVHGRENGPL